MDSSNTKEASQLSQMFKNFVAGGFGGSCLVVAGHPLDTIKVRLQTQPYTADGKPSLYTGTFDCASKIIKRESILGLYKGMLTPLAGIAPIYALYFLSFNLGKKLQQKSEDHVLNMRELFIAGGMAGLSTVVIVAPGERIKCLLQIQNNKKGEAASKYSGPADCAKKLYKQGGLKNIYVGTVATIYRDVPGSAIYFMAYEYLQRQLLPEGKTRDQLSPLRTIFAGGMAGVFNWMIAIPPDVLKSKQQTAAAGEYSGFLDVLKKTLKSDGIQGLYKGATPVMLRAFPANAACFLGFELMIKFLNRIMP